MNTILTHNTHFKIFTLPDDSFQYSSVLVRELHMGNILEWVYVIYLHPQTKLQICVVNIKTIYTSLCNVNELIYF